MFDWLDQAHHALFGPNADLLGYHVKAVLLGQVLWIAAYALILVRGARDGMLGIPLIAIFLNITWEGIILTDCVSLNTDGWCRPFPVAEWDLAIEVIFGLDLLLLLQAFILIRIRWGFVATLGMFVAGLGASYLFHVNFVPWAEDDRLLIDSWVINLVMSLLFIWLVLVRPAGKGLSYLAAWAKLLGSLAVIVGLWFHPGDYLFVGDRKETAYILAFVVLALDVAYVALLRRRLPAADLAG